MCIPRELSRRLLGFSAHYSWLTCPGSKPTLCPGGTQLCLHDRLHLGDPAESQSHRPGDQPPCVGTLWTTALWGPAATWGAAQPTLSPGVFPSGPSQSRQFSPLSWQLPCFTIARDVFPKATCFVPHPYSPRTAPWGPIVLWVFLEQEWKYRARPDCMLRPLSSSHPTEMWEERVFQQRTVFIRHVHGDPQQVSNCHPLTEV